MKLHRRMAYHASRETSSRPESGHCWASLLRSGVSAGALALGAGLCLPVSAQEAGADQSQSEGGFTLEEIKVTATRRETTLQDVSSSLSVVGSDELMKQQIHSINDLQFLVPSITIGEDFQVAKLFIRGVGINTSTTGVQPSVAVHVDGAVIGRPEFQTTSIFDLERVEVLRGPQGSLYGRNAVGGSINFVTAKPTSEPEGYVRATIGKFSQINTEGALSGPITDNILGRVAFKTENRDGYGENVVTGNEIDNVDRRMARLHLDFLPTEDFDFRLTGEWFKQDDRSGALKFIRETFVGVPSLASPARGGFAEAPRDLSGEFDPSTEKETWSVTGEFNWRITDDLTLKNITSFRRSEGSFAQDISLSSVITGLVPEDIPTDSLVPIGTTNTGNAIQRRDLAADQWTTEFQANYVTPWIDAVFGFFYFDEQQTPVNTIGQSPNFGMEQNIEAFENRLTFLGPPPPSPAKAIPNLTLAEAHATCNTLDLIDTIDRDLPPPPKRVCINSTLNSEAWSIYGQARIELGELAEPLRNFTLKLGGRFTHEEVSSVNPAHVILSLGTGPVMVFTEEQTATERTFEPFNPEVGLEWRPSENVMFYYTYVEGFKAGSAENNAGSRTILDPEEIDNNEFGVKTSFFGGRLSFNVAGFFYEITNLQVNRTFPDPNQGFRIVFENAAEASAHGIEVDFSASVTPRLRFNGSAAYLDSEVDEFLSANPIDPRNNPNFVDFDPNVSTEIDLAGNATRNSPEWTANIHGEFDLLVGQMPAEGDLTVTMDLSYRGETFFTEFNDPIQSEEEFAFLDASLRYISGDGRINAEFWAKNLTDQLRKSATFDLATAAVIGANYHPPRTFGFSVGYNF